MLSAYTAEPIDGKASNFLSTRHTASYVDEKLWIWGGSKGFPPEKVNDMISFDIATKKWTKIDNFNGEAPSPRSDHAAAVVGKNIYIFGGSDKTVSPMNDLHYFDVETLTWRQPQTKGIPPSPRSGHTMVSVGNKIYVYGGAKWNSSQNAWTEKSNDMWVFDTETFTWSKLQVYGSVPKVATFVAAWVMGHHIWILGGGRTEEDYVSDTCHCFDTVTRTWTSCEFTGDAFIGKDCVSATVVGSNVMLFGGYRGDPVNSLQFVDMVWASKMKKYGFVV
jgi:N-acetylneuraminic acid mutarotase